MNQSLNTRPKKVRMTISVDEEIFKKLKELSEKDDRSFSQYVNRILKEYVAENQYQV